MKKKLLLTAAVALLAGGQQMHAQKKISTDLFGIFFEDINYGADGGLYAEMVQNRSFEYRFTDPAMNNNRDAHWNPLTAWQWIGDRRNANELNVLTDRPLNENNTHYVSVKMNSAALPEALANNGYDGMVLKAGDSYDFSAFLRQNDGTGMVVGVALMAGDTIVCEKSLTVDSKDWKKYELTLTSTVDATDGKVALYFRQKGHLDIDMVSLFPQKTFKNRRNGFRADMAQMLADLKPSFVRFPGGCVAHGNGVENIYDWKNSVLPLEQRREDRNVWGYRQSFGIGYHDYLQFCEDINAKPLPVLAVGVSCQFPPNKQEVIPMSEMGKFTQDVLDLIEYCNGDVNTTWGAKRAANGHPASFNLEYLGIGNEDQMTSAFKERFKMICDAVAKKYPKIKIIGTSGPWHSGSDFVEGWKVSREQGVYAVDEHYYERPEWFLKNMKRYDNYDRKGPKVYLGEYASKSDKWYNAVVEAAYLTGLERNGDIVVMSSYAPLFAKNGYTQWTPDMIYFDNTKIYPSASYQVQKLYGNNTGDLYYDNVVSFDSDAQGLAASCVKDSRTGSVIVKLVNPTANAATATIDLKSVGKYNKKVTVTTMQGNPDTRNHIPGSDAVLPQVKDETIAKKSVRELPPYSFVIIRTKSK